MSRTLVTRKPEPSATGSPQEDYLRHTSTRQIRLILVDSHEIVRVGVRALLDQARHVEIIGEAGTVTAAVEEAHRLRPDVMVIELQLPDGRGVDAFRRIHEASPDSRLLVLTHGTDEWSIVSAMRSGAAGFLFKTITGPELVRAVETVGAGQSILDPAVPSSVIAHIRNQPVSICEKTGAMLSPQEHCIMKLVVQGKTNKEIAGTLCLSDKTVKNYLSHVYDKLQVTCRAHATSVFLQHTYKT
ncbi:MAG: response regulator transcription factor [Nitrospira sp.]|nr:response regulator transcription factor [Nitrospira sp.]